MRALAPQTPQLNSLYTNTTETNTATESEADRPAAEEAQTGYAGGGRKKPLETGSRPAGPEHDTERLDGFTARKLAELRNVAGVVGDEEKLQALVALLTVGEIEEIAGCNRSKPERALREVCDLAAAKLAILNKHEIGVLRRKTGTDFSRRRFVASFLDRLTLAGIVDEVEAQIRTGEFTSDGRPLDKQGQPIRSIPKYIAQSVYFRACDLYRKHVAWERSEPDPSAEVIAGFQVPQQTQQPQPSAPRPSDAVHRWHAVMQARFGDKWKEHVRSIYAEHCVGVTRDQAFEICENALAANNFANTQEREAVSIELAMRKGGWCVMWLVASGVQRGLICINSALTSSAA